MANYRKMEKKEFQGCHKKSKKSQNLFLACDPKLVFTVGMQHCSAQTEKTIDSESPIEISSARNGLKNETLEKICHEIDHVNRTRL